MGDLLLWRGAKKYVGIEAAHIAMILNLLCRYQTTNISLCFTNSVEQILSVIAFNYFMEQKNMFNWNTVKLTATITLSFIRTGMQFIRILSDSKRPVYEDTVHFTVL